jgi:hypothetical protein
VTISPTFFRSKDKQAAFLYLQFRLKFFLHKKSERETVRKMLVKLTRGEKIRKKDFIFQIWR